MRTGGRRLTTLTRDHQHQRNTIPRDNTSTIHTYPGINPTTSTERARAKRYQRSYRSHRNQGTKTLKETQPEHTEAAPKVNGIALNPEVIVEPDESQTTIS
jgi:hypothetical protein